MTLTPDETRVPTVRSRRTSDRLVNVLAALTYAVLLVFLYRVELSTYWSYMGFDWDLNGFKFALAIIVIGLTSFVLPTAATTRNILLQLGAYFHLFPSLLIYALLNLGSTYLMSVGIGTALLMGFSFLPIKRFKAPSLTWSQVFWVAMLINLMVLAALVAFRGVGSFSLNPQAVYELRAASEERLPGIFGYLRPATTKVMLPVVLILAFALRSRKMIVVTVLIAVAFFGYSHHKVILFASFAAIILFLVLKRVRSTATIGYLAIILLTACVLSLTWSWLTGDLEGASRLVSIVVRRAIFVPVLLDALHVEFFSDNPFYFWSQSTVGLGIASNPYGINAPNLIGLEFFGNAEMSANTGYVGAGYSNAGLAGIAIYGTIIGLVIAYLHEYGKIVGHPLTVTVAFTLIFGAMRGSDLPTIFMTHGLSLLLVFLVFFPKNGCLPHSTQRGA